SSFAELRQAGLSMGVARLAIAIGLLVTLAAGAVAVAAWERSSSSAAASGAFPVAIVGPANATPFDGTVRVAAANAVSALRARCEQGHLDVETVEYPGMGTYLRPIGGH